jgi:hypothetical protein
MIALTYWQLAGLLLAVAAISSLGTALALACVAMASYDGDELRSEEE